ncbi:MAG: hypothetical protein HY075_16695, partial [Deltaproteobacteria bacterium]|nr:hypothetical protein [Deltaproteobacteria bacterium]
MRIRYLALMIAEHASTRALDALTTLALIRLLDVSSLGTLVVYQSWVAILLLFFPALENVLYREHGKLKAAGQLSRELAIYRKFNVMKLGFALSLTFFGALVPVKDVDFGRRLAALALAFAVPLSQALYGIFREPLRFELRQGVVVLLNGLQRLVLLALVYAAGRLTGGAIEPIAVAALCVYLVFGGLWATVSDKLLLEGKKRARVALKEAWPRIRGAFTETVLWLHLSGAIMGAVQTLDVYFLSRTSTPLREIAAYSIALKAANFFQLLSLPVTQAFGVYLGRRSNRHDARADRRAAVFAVAAFAAVGVLVIAFGFTTAEPLLGFLAKGKFTPDELANAVRFFRPMLVGVVVLSLGYAPGTYLGSRGD